MRSWLAGTAGATLLGGSIVLFSRAGYGPFGDSAYRGRPCTVDRCPHNALILFAAAVAVLSMAARRPAAEDRVTG
jgi:hypothetical protein